LLPSVSIRSNPHDALSIMTANGAFHLHNLFTLSIRQRRWTATRFIGFTTLFAGQSAGPCAS
jgi:hypothetical protein